MKTEFYITGLYVYRKMYILTFVHRSHLTGNITIQEKSFDTIDSVSKFLQDDWYDRQFVNWDNDDMGCNQPSRNNFTSKELESKLGKMREVELYGPYSKFRCHIPDEVILTSEVN